LKEVGPELNRGRFIAVDAWLKAQFEGIRQRVLRVLFVKFVERASSLDGA
jgi:hypothetical protein